MSEIDVLVQERLGWRLVTFLLEACEGAPEAQVSMVRLFGAYQAWCDKHGLVPLSEGVFVEQMGPICEVGEIAIKQAGANVWLLGVRLVENAA